MRSAPIFCIFFSLHKNGRNRSKNKRSRKCVSVCVRGRDNGGCEQGREKKKMKKIKKKTRTQKHESLLESLESCNCTVIIFLLVFFLSLFFEGCRWTWNKTKQCNAKKKNDRSRSFFISLFQPPHVTHAHKCFKNMKKRHKKKAMKKNSIESEWQNAVEIYWLLVWWSQMLMNDAERLQYKLAIST